MNKEKRTLYSQMNLRRVKRWEGVFIRQIKAALHAEMSRIAVVLKEHGLQAAQNEAHKIIMVDGIAAVIRNLYIFVGIASARRVYSEVKKSAKGSEVKAGGFGFDAVWNNLILKYFKLYLLTKAVLPISEETRRIILEILNKGITEGWSIDKMAEELLADDVNLARAKLIARTEIVKSQFYGEELGIESSEWETNEIWISAHDHRVRSSHRKVDGEILPSGGKWKVERIRNKIVVGYDMMKGPGDPTAHIENLANCRCVRSVVAARDERGRLILKRKNIVDLQEQVTL